jgi:hypothetical protein
MAGVNKLPFQYLYMFALFGSDMLLPIWNGYSTDHSPPTSAVVKKTWIYTSTPASGFMAQCCVKHRAATEDQVRQRRAIFDPSFVIRGCYNYWKIQKNWQVNMAVTVLPEETQWVGGSMRDDWYWACAFWSTIDCKMCRSQGVDRSAHARHPRIGIALETSMSMK